ncbi:MAG: hypothetical protein Fur0043_26680 [Anaerolineales bacterium]
MPAKNVFNLDDLLRAIGQAGRRMSEIGASEGAAGNISVCLRRGIDLGGHFPQVELIELPQAAPHLVGACILVSGSGCRLRDLLDEPTANLAAILVQPGGRTAQCHTAPARRFQRVTSEFNSHLAVHDNQAGSSGADVHALLHAQPVHLTYLSHIPRYQDENYLNARLFRWQPETVVTFPEGIGLVPFCVPGSAHLMTQTVVSLRTHRLVVWAKHGVMARSDVSVLQAADAIEYAEAAATYEYLDLCAGEIASGLSADEIRAIRSAFRLG